MKPIWTTSILLLAALAVPVHAQSSRPSPTADVQEGYVTTPDGVRLYYQKVGSGSKTVILPGRLFAFEEFRRLAPRYTLISYDMRNRGRSDFVIDGSKVTLQADVEDLETVRRHFGVQKFTPIGYSYLGLMVVLYAIEHAEHVDRLIQMGPVPLKFGIEYQPQFVAGDAKEVWEAGGGERLRKLREDDFHLTHPQEYCVEEWKVMRFLLVGDPARVDRVDRLVESVCALPNEWPVNQRRHLRLHFVESVQKLDVPRKTVTQVQVPVLTIHGTKDRNAPYAAGREWAYLLPNARLLTVEGAAHQSFAEAPEIVFPAVEGFLQGDWPPASEKVTTDPRKQP